VRGLPRGLSGTLPDGNAQPRFVGRGRLLKPSRRPELKLAARIGQAKTTARAASSWARPRPPNLLAGVTVSATVARDIAVDWQYDPALKTEIEVRFIPEGKDRTRVELEHRRLDRHGARRDEMRHTFDSSGDWGRILQMFAGLLPPSALTEAP
jgi:hypothetical protein